MFPEIFITFGVCACVLIDDKLQTAMSEDYIQYVDLHRWPVEEGIWFLIYAVGIVIIVWTWAWNKQRRT